MTQIKEALEDFNDCVEQFGDNGMVEETIETIRHCLEHYEKMVEVLEYYADLENYRHGYEYCENIAVGFSNSDIENDGGEKARETLKQARGEKCNAS